MMYSSSDLKYIESEMLHVILSDTESSCDHPLESSDSIVFNAVETPTDCYRWVKDTEAKRLYTVNQLERLWHSDPEDSSKKGYKRP